MSFKEVTSLGSVVKCLDSKRIPLSNKERESKQGHYPYYGAAGIIDYVNEPIFSGLYLLMGEDGSVIKEDGTPVLQLVSGEFWVNNHAHVLQGETDLETRFLYYALGNTNIQGFVTGAVQPKLNQTNMNKIPVYFPGKSIRKRIVEILGSLDDKIELNRQTNATLEAIAQAIFKEWFVDFNYPGATGEMVESELGPIPKGWKVNKLSGLAAVSSGKGLKRSEFTTEGYPVLGANGQIGFSHHYLLEDEVILTGRVGTLGTLQLINNKAWISDNVLIIKPKDPFYYHYLYFWLRTIDFQNLNRGSTQPLLTKTDLQNLLILRPDINVFIDYDRLCRRLFTLVENHQNEAGILSEIRDLLLPKLMNPKINLC